MVGNCTDMSYRFKASDNSAEAAFRRVALSQINGALAHTGDLSLPSEHVVHEARKSCKKLRALIRLVRPGFGPYQQENEAFRDMARILGGTRDQDVMILTCDRLSAHNDIAADRSTIAAIRASLIDDREATAGKGELHERLRAFHEAMQQARNRAENWRLEKNGFDAFAGGLIDTLQRARKAMVVARANPTADNLHEWRKSVKYHWYHARLLRNIWPASMDAHVKAASDLADLLGDHHDLFVLREKLVEAPQRFGEPGAIRSFAEVVAKREREEEHQAFELGGLLLAERARALAKRWQAYWTLWREKD